VKLELIAIGRTDKDYLRQGMDIFAARIKRYLPFEYIEIPDIKNTKNMPEAEQKEKEGEVLLRRIDNKAELWLFDNAGKMFDSVGFSAFIEGKMLNGPQTASFAIGGPYGFSENVYSRASGKISLSPMTFSHQMVRLICLEQIYRGMSIIRGEPYHHQ
jgi:23S rRNA (pseudouridine1915-N3)-methyltransferase